MLLGMIAAALVAISSPVSADERCGLPGSELDRRFCDDAELLAWAKAATSLQADQDASHPGPYGVGANEWRSKVRTCVEAQCVRASYADWLAALVEPNARPPFPVRRALIYKLKISSHSKNTLKVRDLGDGWALFILEGYVVRPVGDGEPFYGADAFVVHLANGSGHYRDSRGNGFDLASQVKGWDVEQVGDCTCATHVSLGGKYR